LKALDEQRAEVMRLKAIKVAGAAIPVEGKLG